MKKMYRIQTLAFSLCFLFFLSIHIASAQSLKESFNLLNQEVIQTSLVDERVMLITDRQIYLCGENIIFHAFMYDGNWFLPLSMSSVLYIELYNQDNSVIARGKYPVINGKCSGIIPIPRTVISNIFYIRAYTSYMKNSGLDQFFTSKLRIVNPFLESPVYSPPTSDQEVINCQIQPEGGTLIHGINNRVGCRFTNLEGKGIPVIARLVDMEDNIISNFQTYKNGFASFEFVPEAGKEYYIEAQGENANTVLPIDDKLRTGTTFSVDTLTAEALKITIRSNDINDFPLRLKARRGEFIYFLKEINSDIPGHYTIALKSIPDGLVTLELVDFKGNSLATRLFYKKPSENLNISMKSDKEEYLNREKIEVTIGVYDNDGLPVKADLVFFANLTNNDMLAAHTDKHLLQQELKQIFLYDEAIISDAINDNEFLELVLLSTPPGNLKVSSPVDGKINTYPKTMDDIISGRLTYRNNQPAKDIEILQSFVGSGTWIESTFTDENGNFHFVNYKRQNEGDLILKVNNPPAETSLLLHDEFYPDFPPPRKEVLSFTNDELELISKQFINIQVDDAYRNEPGIERLTNQEATAFYGKVYQEYVFGDYIKLPNMWEFIYEVITGVTLTKVNEVDVINILEDKTQIRIGPNPLVIIDGVPIVDASIVAALVPEEVKMIRVVRYKYFYKNQIFDGILDIFTHKNDASAFSLPPDTFRFNYDLLKDDFKILESQNLSVDGGRIPVYRNLLYWNSELTTDKDGKSVLSFDTPDNSGIFEIHCFARTQEGNIAVVRKFISIGE